MWFHLFIIQKFQSDSIVITSLYPPNIPQMQFGFWVTLYKLGNNLNLGGAVELDSVSCVPLPISGCLNLPPSHIWSVCIPLKVKWLKIWCVVSLHTALLPSPHCMLDASILWNIWTQSKLIFSISSVLLKIKADILPTLIYVPVANKRTFSSLWKECFSTQLLPHGRVQLTAQQWKCSKVIASNQASSVRFPWSTGKSHIKRVISKHFSLNQGIVIPAKFEFIPCCLVNPTLGNFSTTFEKIISKSFYTCLLMVGFFFSFSCNFLRGIKW